LNRWTPCKRRDFIRALKKLGFIGPFSGTRHQFMVYHTHRLSIPSYEEYSVPQLRVLIAEIETILHRSIPLGEWESLV